MGGRVRCTALPNLLPDPYHRVRSKCFRGVTRRTGNTPFSRASRQAGCALPGEYAVCIEDGGRQGAIFLVMAESESENEVRVRCLPPCLLFGVPVGSGRC